jgi:3-oxoacyl-[acyl-carrier protein] reductase
MNRLFERPAMVVGASRGLGRSIAMALAEAGGHVVAVSRSKAEFPGTTNSAGMIQTEIADAAEATVAARLIESYEPASIILVAGASPHMRPLQHQTWETFSVNWQTDVRIAFHWLREALLTPLAPGSRMIVFSSGAALNTNGSPLSGGYAGAKATERFITGYAQDEATRAGLEIVFTTVLPQFAPLTGVGRPAVKAYAVQSGLPVDDFLRAQPFPLLTEEIAGRAIVELLQADSANVSRSYLLNGAGLHELT